MIVPTTLFVPLLLFYGFQTVTEDPLSAVVLVLLLLVTVAAGFAGRPIAGEPAHAFANGIPEPEDLPEAVSRYSRLSFGSSR